MTSIGIEESPQQFLTARNNRRVARWLLLGVAMLVIQILLGGITRLTGSGLSITEWQPILGAVPPITEAAWQEAFNKYQGIAQFQVLNQHFTLTDFKHIYFWEWLHRDWARLIAVVFLVGFVYFLIKRAFSREMVLPFVILFVLGALQGAIGWLMVASGLNDTNLYVSHIRLAVHFMAALVLVCYPLWLALQLLIKKTATLAAPGLRSSTVGITALLCVQLVYGAFMAGLKAAQTAPTWPTINGRWTPGDLSTLGSRTYTGIDQWISHPLAVHFIHRNLAYVLTVLIVWLAVRVMRAARRNGKPLVAKVAGWSLVLVCLQVGLGIFTVLSADTIQPYRFGVFEYLAQAHQLIAMSLLLVLVTQIFVLSEPRIKRM